MLWGLGGLRWRVRSCVWRCAGGCVVLGARGFVRALGVVFWDEELVVALDWGFCFGNRSWFWPCTGFFWNLGIRG